MKTTDGLSEDLFEWFRLMFPPDVSRRMTEACIDDGTERMLRHGAADANTYRWRGCFSPQNWLTAHTGLTKRLIETGRPWLRHMEKHPLDDPDSAWDAIIDLQAERQRSHFAQVTSCPYSDGHTCSRPYLRGENGRLRFQRLIRETVEEWGLEPSLCSCDPDMFTYEDPDPFAETSEYPTKPDARATGWLRMMLDRNAMLRDERGHAPGKECWRENPPVECHTTRGLLVFVLMDGTLLGSPIPDLLPEPKPMEGDGTWMF
ncbi:hypothetical protein [Bifidobacterium sp. SO1]|uniref:hypothetical protein n=1 Tax=Bifidobacterium sp. SO1 TaxID=2809029 RepID=UPI001BDD3332|nr:hypothetical protein [Bifidobacterium sp. SO1]MBT1161694.1 hypothetical protein [Bifidobacterium sp. SO1]